MLALHLTPTREKPSAEALWGNSEKDGRALGTEAQAGLGRQPNHIILECHRGSQGQQVPRHLLTTVLGCTFTCKTQALGDSDLPQLTKGTAILSCLLPRYSVRLSSECAGKRSQSR